MWFWITMFLCNSMIPVIMLVVGWMMEKHTPKTINGLYGYRTSMSMKNAMTWNYAHAVCGRLWYRIGLVLLPVSVVVQLPFIKSGVKAVGIVAGVLCTVQCILLIGSIFVVERALKKAFHPDGSPRQGVR